MDSGTDTDTMSSVGETWYDYDDIPDGLDDNAKAEELFWAYQKAKGRYRKFMRKPVRRVRRFMKRKGKGKGKHPGYYLTTLKDQEIEEIFFCKGPKKGKGTGKRSTGKGKGRRTNPKGPDGKIMKCRKCGSIEHFQRECPKNQGGGNQPHNGPAGNAPGNPNYYVNPSTQQEQSVSLLTPGPHVRIFELVGNREYPLPSNDETVVTFYSDNSRGVHGPAGGNYFMTCFMFNRVNTYSGDPAEIPVDPWSDYRTRQTPDRQDGSLFTRAEYDAHMSRTFGLRNPLLEGSTFDRTVVFMMKP